jgi:hypothetical protein
LVVDKAAVSFAVAFPRALFFFVARGGPASSFSSRFARATAALETISFFGAFRFLPLGFAGCVCLAAFLLVAVLRRRLEGAPIFGREGRFAMRGSMNLYTSGKQYPNVCEP